MPIHRMGTAAAVSRKPVEAPADGRTATTSNRSANRAATPAMMVLAG